MNFVNASSDLNHYEDDNNNDLMKRFGLNINDNNRHIPQHIWDIYNEQYGIDWIRHYYPNDIVDNNSGFILSFNLSVAARNAHEEQVIKAILKLRLRRNTTKRNINEVIHIYLNNSELNERTLINSHSISNISNNYWIDIDVTEVLSNHYLDVINFYIDLPNGIKIDESENSSMNMSRNHHTPLIVFSDHLYHSNSRRRRKRSISSSSQTTGHNERKNRKKGRKHQTSKADNTLCRRIELYVDFEELEWQNWIMAPKGYEAGQCQGTCTAPIPAHLNASNHAILQSLIHLVNPDDVPPPCCVPTETSPLSILYMDTDNVIVIKAYEDMRVEACGCR